MNTDRDKLKALVLYIVWKTSHVEDFGATKLNKVMWFSEARAFEARGKPLAGDTFVRDKYGPRSKNIASVCKELESEGLIQSFEEDYFGRVVHRHRALAPPQDLPFSKEDLSLVDWWIKTIAEDHTATSISRLSHDYGWELAQLGEELPLYAFLAKRIRHPDSEELERAKKNAEKLGLK